MESQFSLMEALSSLGMRRAFDPRQADFKGITAGQPLFISAVIHKAFIKVDEEGTEAAAATGVVAFGGVAIQKRPEPKIFKADHPFVFAIVHQKSGAMLFMGRVASP